ncbi:MAG: dynamin family protein [Anaerolineae bacterium]|nr:dynamin family protein [Anaerolineae bacterium]
MTTPSLSSTTSTVTLEGPVAELREREIRLLHDIADHIGTLGTEGAADRQRLIDASTDLREMFYLVVVIGEFNAGKSTFVNALLGDTVLPMGITPTTDMIELIRYSPLATRMPNVRDDAVREWKHPNTGIPGVVIVDTPGTGSVFSKHEQIAKNFLHRSDLVIFVISAKRAFADTERLYLELAKNYGKKIIIVINQIDLLDTKEQNDVRAFVQRQVNELLDLRPPIFMVSAKKALNGEKSGGLLSGLIGGKDDYGLNAVRTYLKETFEQVPPAKQKLLTHLELARRLLQKYVGEVQSKLSLIGADTNAAEDLQREIEQQASNLDRQLNSTLVEVHNIFEAVRKRGDKFVEKNIRIVRATIRGVDKDALQKEFERDVIGDVIQRLTSTQEFYVNALVDSGRAYWRGVLERLNRMDALLKEEAASMDAATYADQRAALQSAMMMADVEMKNYTNQQVIDSIQTDFEANIRNFAYGAVGSIGGLIAVILAIATPGHLALYPLAAIGFVVGGLVALAGGGAAVVALRTAVNRARKQLNEKIDELENTYKDSLVKLTNHERNRLLQYGKQILTPVFSQLQALAQRLRDQQAEVSSYSERLSALDKEINDMKMMQVQQERRG